MEGREQVDGERPVHGGDDPGQWTPDFDAFGLTIDGTNQILHFASIADATSLLTLTSPGFDNTGATTTYDRTLHWMVSD